LPAVLRLLPESQNLAGIHRQQPTTSHRAKEVTPFHDPFRFCSTTRVTAWPGNRESLCD
jgi:hypothetical protein